LTTTGGSSRGRVLRSAAGWLLLQDPHTERFWRTDLVRKWCRSGDRPGGL